MSTPLGKTVRVGVIGVGALGQHHARVYAALEGVLLAGVYDVDAGRAGEVAARHGTRAFAHLRELLPEVDAVSVAVPTVDHLRVARAALEAGKDVLVEKPMTTTLAEADEMIALAEARGAVLQVGHIERFNPAVEVLRRVPEPRFVEVHRLGSFSPRSLDIDVVLDLMIHDLDLVLSLDGTEAVQVDAVGVPVLTPRVDIANARLRFAVPRALCGTRERDPGDVARGGPDAGGAGRDLDAARSARRFEIPARGGE